MNSRGIKEIIHFHRENPSLNKGGCLRHILLKVHDVATKKIPNRLSSCDNLTPSRNIEREEHHSDRPEETSRMRCDTVDTKDS